MATRVGGNKSKLGSGMESYISSALDKLENMMGDQTASYDIDTTKYDKKIKEMEKETKEFRKEAEKPIDVFNYDKGSVKKRVEELKTSINAAMDVVNSGGKLTKNNGISVKNFLKDYGELNFYFEKIGQEMDSSIKQFYEKIITSLQNQSDQYVKGSYNGDSELKKMAEKGNVQSKGEYIKAGRNEAVKYWNKTQSSLQNEINSQEKAQSNADIKNQLDEIEQRAKQVTDSIKQIFKEGFDENGSEDYLKEKKRQLEEYLEEVDNISTALNNIKIDGRNRELSGKQKSINDLLTSGRTQANAVKSNVTDIYDALIAEAERRRKEAQEAIENNQKAIEDLIRSHDYFGDFKSSEQNGWIAKYKEKMAQDGADLSAAYKEFEEEISAAKEAAINKQNQQQEYNNRREDLNNFIKEIAGGDPELIKQYAAKYKSEMTKVVFDLEESIEDFKKRIADELGVRAAYGRRSYDPDDELSFDDYDDDEEESEARASSESSKRAKEAWEEAAENWETIAEIKERISRAHKKPELNSASDYNEYKQGVTDRSWKYRIEEYTDAEDQIGTLRDTLDKLIRDKEEVQEKIARYEESYNQGFNTNDEEILTNYGDELDQLYEQALKYDELIGFIQNRLTEGLQNFKPGDSWGEDEINVLITLIQKLVEELSKLSMAFGQIDQTTGTSTFQKMTDNISQISQAIGQIDEGVKFTTLLSNLEKINAILGEVFSADKLENFSSQISVITDKLGKMYSSIGVDLKNRIPEELVYRGGGGSSGPSESARKEALEGAWEKEYNRYKDAYDTALKLFSNYDSNFSSVNNILTGYTSFLNSGQLEDFDFDQKLTQFTSNITDTKRSYRQRIEDIQAFFLFVQDYLPKIIPEGGLNLSSEISQIKQDLAERRAQGEEIDKAIEDSYIEEIRNREKASKELDRYIFNRKGKGSVRPALDSSRLQKSIEEVAGLRKATTKKNKNIEEMIEDTTEITSLTQLYKRLSTSIESLQNVIKTGLGIEAIEGEENKFTSFLSQIVEKMNEVKEAAEQMTEALRGALKHITVAEGESALSAKIQESINSAPYSVNIEPSDTLPEAIQSLLDSKEFHINIDPMTGKAKGESPAELISQMTGADAMMSGLGTQTHERSMAFNSQTGYHTNPFVYDQVDRVRTNVIEGIITSATEQVDTMMHTHPEAIFPSFSLANYNKNTGQYTSDLLGFYGQNKNYGIGTQINAAQNGVSIFNAKDFYGNYGDLFNEANAQETARKLDEEFKAAYQNFRTSLKPIADVFSGIDGFIIPIEEMINSIGTHFPNVKELSENLKSKLSEMWKTSDGNFDTQSFTSEFLKYVENLPDDYGKSFHQAFSDFIKESLKKMDVDANEIESYLGDGSEFLTSFKTAYNNWFRKIMKPDAFLPKVYEYLTPKVMDKALGIKDFDKYVNYMSMDQFRQQYSVPSGGYTDNYPSIINAAKSAAAAKDEFSRANKEAAASVDPTTQKLEEETLEFNAIRESAEGAANSKNKFSDANNGVAKDSLDKLKITDFTSELYNTLGIKNTQNQSKIKADLQPLFDALKESVKQGTKFDFKDEDFLKLMDTIARSMTYTKPNMGDEWKDFYNTYNTKKINISDAMKRGFGQGGWESISNSGFITRNGSGINLNSVWDEITNSYGYLLQDVARRNGYDMDNEYDQVFIFIQALKEAREEIKNTQISYDDLSKDMKEDADYSAFQIVEELLTRIRDKIIAIKKEANNSNTQQDPRRYNFAGDITKLDNYSSASTEFVSNLIADVLSGTKEYDTAMEELKSHIEQRQKELLEEQEKNQQRALELISFSQGTKPIVDSLGLSDEDLKKSGYYDFFEKINSGAITSQDAIAKFAKNVGYSFDEVKTKGEAAAQSTETHAQSNERLAETEERLAGIPETGSESAEQDEIAAKAADKRAEANERLANSEERLAKFQNGEVYTNQTGLVDDKKDYSYTERTGFAQRQKVHITHLRDKEGNLVYDDNGDTIEIPTRTTITNYEKLENEIIKVDKVILKLQDDMARALEKRKDTTAIQSLLDSYGDYSSQLQKELNNYYKDSGYMPGSAQVRDFYQRRKTESVRESNRLQMRTDDQAFREQEKLNKELEKTDALIIRQQGNLDNIKLKYIDNAGITFPDGALDKVEESYNRAKKLINDLRGKAATPIDTNNIAVAIQKYKILAQEAVKAQKVASQFQPRSIEAQKENLTTGIGNLERAMKSSKADTSALETELGRLKESLTTGDVTKSFLEDLNNQLRSLKSKFENVKNEFKFKEDETNKAKKALNDYVSAVQDVAKAQEELDFSTKSDKSDLEKKLEDAKARAVELREELKKVVHVLDGSVNDGRIQEDEKNALKASLGKALSVEKDPTSTLSYQARKNNQENEEMAKERSQNINNYYTAAIRALNDYKKATTEVNNYEAKELNGSAISIERKTELLNEQAKAAQRAVDAMKMLSAMHETGDVTDKQLRDAGLLYSEAKSGTSSSRTSLANAQAKANQKELENYDRLLNEYENAVSKVAELTGKLQASGGKDLAITQELAEAKQKANEARDALLEVSDVLDKDFVAKETRDNARVRALRADKTLANPESVESYTTGEYAEIINILQKATEARDRYNKMLTEEARGVPIPKEQKSGIINEVNETAEAAGRAIDRLEALYTIEKKISEEQYNKGVNKVVEATIGTDETRNNLEKQLLINEKKSIDKATEAVNKYHEAVKKAVEMQEKFNTGDATAKQADKARERAEKLKKEALEGQKIIEDAYKNQSRFVDDSKIEDVRDKFKYINGSILGDSSGDYGFETMERGFKTLIKNAERYAAIMQKQKDNQPISYSDIAFLQKYGDYYQQATKRSGMFTNAEKEAGEAVKQFDDALSKAQTNAFDNTLEKLAQDLIKLNGLFVNQDGTDAIDKLRAKYDELTKTVDKYGRESEEAKRALDDYNNSYRNFEENRRGGYYTKADDSKVSQLRRQMSDWIYNNSAAPQATVDQIKNLQASLNGISAGGLEDVKAAFEDIKTKAAEAGTVGKSFGDTLKKSFQGLARYLMTYTSFYRVINMIRQAVGQVRELDTALMEVRKVSTESLDSLKQWQKTTFNQADLVGTTAQQIQESTASWLRLGKSFTEAQDAAVASNWLLNVSEFQNIDDATTALMSITQAFNDLSFENVIDSLNAVGDHYSSATDQLASGLQNAAAVLKIQGNDINKSLALLTAGELLPESMETYFMYIFNCVERLKAYSTITKKLRYDSLIMYVYYGQFAAKYPNVTHRLCVISRG